MKKTLKHLKNSFKITRRKFLASISIAFLSYLMKPVNYAYSLIEEKGKYPVAPGKLIKGEFKFFNHYQATVVEEVTSLIIPPDELAGSRKAGVVFEIDHILSNASKPGTLYALGLKWLDYMAWGKYKKKSFLDLSYNEKVEILKIADSGKLPDINDRSPRRKSSSEVVRLFFEVIKQHSFETFYTSLTGWEVVGYQGPPQRSGNKDYYECS